MATVIYSGQDADLGNPGVVAVGIYVAFRTGK